MEACDTQRQIAHNMGKIETEWALPENISTNSGNNSTLLYIAVEYVKDEFKQENDTQLSSPSANFSTADFPEHVSTLDPNMSSVARYSPVYNDTTNYNPVVIHQLVSSDPNEETTFVDNLGTSSSLEALPTVLCSSDLSSVGNQYLQMVDTGIMDTDSGAIQSIVNAAVSKKEQDVEILITDQATGISYSVSTQELLVEEQHLLEALSPNPLLDSELLTIDENILKNNLPGDLIDSTVNTVTDGDLATNFINNFSSLKEERFETEEEHRKLRKRASPNILECEDKLLSRVYSIVDKPIPTRARATLPEDYLRIIKIETEWAVFAKKCIRKRTQFGPVQGILKNREEILPNTHKLELLLNDEGGKILGLDISDEEHSNWMCFIRKAESYEEQNLVVSQHESSLYFTVIKNILPKQELKVGYSYVYATQFNFKILEKVPTEDQWPCFECSENFSSLVDLQNHLNIHEQNVKEQVKFRRKILKNRKKLIKVTTTEAGQCRICQQVLNPPKPSVLKKHLSLQHNIQDAQVEDHFYVVRNYKCEKCNVVFNWENLLKIHNLQHNRDSNDDNSDDETYHICPQCNRKFPTQRQLVIHVSVHSLPKYKIIPERFHCPFCSTSYPVRERLQKHMLVHGPEESKPFQCSHCKKRFLNSSALTCHLKTHIVDENIYECPICKDRFDHVLKLKNHVQKHCVNNTYTCPQCNKKFGAYSVIRKHIRAFHSERKHVCQHCSKIFPTMDKLKTHLLRHSDHREFLCAGCGKQFKRKDKLNDHCKKVHSEERENNVPRVRSNESKKITPKTESTDFERFIYKCHHCLIGFKRRGMLVNHLAKRHPDISLDSVPELNLPILRPTKDYYCQYCDKVYKSSSKRKSHILKNHPGAALPISNRKQGAYSEVPGHPNPSFCQTVGSVTTSPQNCNWCHKQYASKAKLLHHQRKEHKFLLEKPQDEININSSAQSVSPRPSKEEMEDLRTLKASEYMVDGKDFTTNVMEEFVDDPKPENQYCHLVSVPDNVFQQEENLGLSGAHLLRLLTNTESMVPPR